MSRKSGPVHIVQKYGLVIVDECHHIAAVSFERVMNAVRANHVYGLSATPVRQDGKHPIVFMQCGPIRYRDNAKQQAQERNIPHLLMPRFTNYRIPSEWGNGIERIQDIFTDLSLSEGRNRQIVQDVREAAESARKILVLTDRKEHVECLANEMRKFLPCVVTLTGSGTNKTKKEKLDSVSHSAATDPLIIVAMGKYIGEGFDAPSLDTLFLVMPFSWKGTLAQYAGRLHRMCEGKESVQIYDYVDMRVPVLERMYGKRLKGYRDLGYKIGVPGIPPRATDFIYSPDDYWEKLKEDLMNSKHMVWISSVTYVSMKVLYVESALITRAHDKLDLKVFMNRTDNENLKQDRNNEITRKRLIAGGFQVIQVQQIQPNTVLIDDRVMWYGSLAPFGYSRDNDNIMRVESPVLVTEMKSMLTGSK
jgi:superfamily II DNA or RNA helicase